LRRWPGGRTPGTDRDRRPGVFQHAGSIQDEEGRTEWDEVGNFLKNACIREGIYDPDKVRGRGAWMDAGRPVMNLGNRLIVGGKSHSLKLPDSDYHYEAAAPLKYVVADPLPKGKRRSCWSCVSFFPGKSRFMQP
jgi:hypothetical protein